MSRNVVCYLIIQLNHTKAKQNLLFDSAIFSDGYA
jgi:hypothetical protein